MLEKQEIRSVVEKGMAAVAALSLLRLAFGAVEVKFVDGAKFIGVKKQKIKHGVNAGERWGTENIPQVVDGRKRVLIENGGGGEISYSHDGETYRLRIIDWEASSSNHRFHHASIRRGENPEVTLTQWRPEMSPQNWAPGVEIRFSENNFEGTPVVE